MVTELSVINFQSPFYEKVLALRQKVLRAPLGMNLFDEDLSDEKNQYIVVLTDDTAVFACVILKILDASTVQFRQMAVDPEFQNSGMGTTVMRYAENFCSLNEYIKVVLHARTSASAFYQKLGYDIEGEEFLEIGIPHFIMSRKLI